jgi:hypothetical protein
LPWKNQFLSLSLSVASLYSKNSTESLTALQTLSFPATFYSPLSSNLTFLFFLFSFLKGRNALFRIDPTFPQELFLFCTGLLNWALCTVSVTGFFFLWGQKPLPSLEIHFLPLSRMTRQPSFSSALF